MNAKRAILLGALLWVLIFFEVSILMFGFKINAPSTTYYALHYPILAILVAIVSFIYFKKEKGSVKEGLILGLWFLLTGIILDAVITVPLFVKSYSFFFSADMLIGYIEIIIVAMIIGAVMKKPRAAGKIKAAKTRKK